MALALDHMGYDWSGADRVLAAIQAAPIVPLTEQERALLEEVDPALPAVPHADIVRAVDSLSDAEG